MPDNTIQIYVHDLSGYFVKTIFNLFVELILTDNQIRNITLANIEELLQSNGRSLREYSDMLCFPKILSQTYKIG